VLACDRVLTGTQSAETEAEKVELHPARIRDFLPTILSSPLLAHLPLETRGTGSSSLLFTPDSQRLVLGLVHSGQVVVLELSASDKPNDVIVLKCLTREESTVGGRVIKSGKVKRRIPRKARKNREIKVNEQLSTMNGHSGAIDVEMLPNGTKDLPDGHDSEADGIREDFSGGRVNGDAGEATMAQRKRKKLLRLDANEDDDGEDHGESNDDEIAELTGDDVTAWKPIATGDSARETALPNGGTRDDTGSSKPTVSADTVANGKVKVNGGRSGSENDEDEADEVIAPVVDQSSEETCAWISCMAASDDGQWLVLCDTSGRTSVFNLDTLQVS